MTGDDGKARKALTFGSLGINGLFVIQGEEGVVYEKIHQGKELNARIVLEGLHTTVHPDTTVEAVEWATWAEDMMEPRPCDVVAEDDALMFAEDLASMPQEARPAAVEFLLKAIRDELGDEEADKLWYVLAHGGAGR